MTKFYHGTVTGKDDLFLESFIITGAVRSENTESIKGQGQNPGLFVSLNPGWAQMFGQSQGQLGRGMVVEFNEEINSQNWDFDHEMSGGYSLALIQNLKHLLPILASDEKAGDDKNMLKAFFSAIETEKNSFDIVYNNHPTEPFSNHIWINLPEKKSALASPKEAYFLEKIHYKLRERFPKEYERKKQALLDEMVKKEYGLLKYIGSSPLKASKIYLKPEITAEMPYEEAIHKLKAPIEEWEVAYEAKSSHALRRERPALKKQPATIRQ